jgi:hypothetical protein
MDPTEISCEAVKRIRLNSIRSVFPMAGFWDYGDEPSGYDNKMEFLGHE